MSVKFRLGFTVDAQTMFSLMAKLLPIDDLQVEELIERPAPMSKLVKASIAIQAPKVRKPYTRTRRGDPPTGGARFAVLQPAFAKGPLRLTEIREIFRNYNFATNGLSSAIAAWVQYGLIEKIGPGQYRLKAKVE
jgi:hypothetical protein